MEFHCNRGVSALSYCQNGTIDECTLNDLTQERPENATNLLFNCDVSFLSGKLIGILQWRCNNLSIDEITL